MKNLTKILLIPVIIISVFYNVDGINTINNCKEKEIVTEKITVYYFHNSRRCATCLAVENESKKHLKELFPNQYKKGEIKFVSVNLEDEAGKKIANKLKVSRQSLLFICGKKRKDLTNDAFMFARANPSKFKSIIKTTVENFSE